MTRKHQTFYFKSIGEISVLEKIEKEEFYKLFKEPIYLNKISLNYDMIDDDEKIKLKMSIFNETKGPKRVYFRKEITTIIFVFKKKTNILYFGVYTKPYKKKKMVGKIRTFPMYFDTNKFTGQLRILYQMVQNSDWKNSNLVEDYISEYKSLVKDFQDKVLDYMGIQDKNMTLREFGFFLRMKKYNVKIPNNWRSFSLFHFNKNQIKKADYNLVSYILHSGTLYSLESKRYRKFLNTTDLKADNVYNIIYNLEIIRDMVGNRYFKEFDLNDFPTFNSIWGMRRRELDDLDITSQDRFNIFKCVKDFIGQKIYDFTTIIEHIVYIHRLHKKIGTSPRFIYKSKEKFDEEHYRVSDMIYKLDNGTINRKYRPEFEKIFDVDLDGFSVKLLKNTDDYFEESEHQRNCVKTYAKDKECFIVSLRNGKKRVTIEYRAEDSKAVRRQTLGFANSNIDMDIYGEALKQLDKVIESYFKEHETLEYEMVTNTIINQFMNYTYPQKISWKNLETRELDTIFEQEYNFTTNI